MKRIPLDLGKPNPIQKRALDCFRKAARFVLMVGGRQVGKSHFGARWLIGVIASEDSRDKLYAAISPTFPMSRVVERKLKEVLRSDPKLWAKIKYRSQPIPTFEFPNGAIIEVRSAHDPDSLRGPTYNAVWFDEIAKSNKEAYDVVLPTLLAVGGKFLGTTTPRGKQNWIYEHIYLKSCPPGHKDYDPAKYNPTYMTVSGSSWENEENLSAEAIIQLEDQYGKHSKFGLQEIAGEFVSFEGLVYAWDEPRNFINEAALPDLHEYSMIIGGIDFGWFPDPFAAAVLGYKDGVWYTLAEIYETKLLLNDQATKLAALGEQFGVGQWYADSARPDNIADLVSRGIPVLPVIKPMIQDRVKEMAMFTDQNRFKVSTVCIETAGELGRYQYPEEDKLARDKNSNPLDKDNHLMDAIGYAIWSVRYLWMNDAKYKVSKHREQHDDEEDPYEGMLAKKKSKFGVSGIIGV